MTSRDQALTAALLCVAVVFLALACVFIVASLAATLVCILTMLLSGVATILCLNVWEQS